jgi:N utilization substance protein A
MKIDLKKIKAAVEQISESRGIEPDNVIEAIEAALGSAYKKEYRKKTEIIKAGFDPKNGDIKFWLEKKVVTPDDVWIPKEDEEVDHDEETFRFNEDRHIFLEEAKKENPDIKNGDIIKLSLEPQDDFGRIAAQTAKQVIIQAVKEAERNSIRQQYSNKEGEIVSGVIQRYERGHIYVDLDRAIGIMFKNESIPGEHYQSGQRMRFYVLAVQEEERGKPGIILSRSHPEFVKKLFELEVPEITEGSVEIKKVAREPGSRTKISVASNEEGVDPVGSIVGQRGSRIMAVINELKDEKIDVVEWSEKIDEYIANALAPAKVKLVEVSPRREAMALVADDQLSLAIGKGGQNVRLAAKLTGWKIDVRPQSNPEMEVEGGVSNIVSKEETTNEEEGEEKNNETENENSKSQEEGEEEDENKEETPENENIEEIEETPNDTEVEEDENKEE